MIGPRVGGALAPFPRCFTGPAFLVNDDINTTVNRWFDCYCFEHQGRFAMYNGYKVCGTMPLMYGLKYQR